MARFVCTIKNFHGSRLYRIGDVYNGSEDNLPKDKKGNLAYFQPIDGDLPAKPATELTVKVNEVVAGATEIIEEVKKK